MATRNWLGGAQAVPQQNTITPVAANSATYTLTINGKAVTYLSDASATVAEITAGLVAAAQASTEPEFAEITWTDETTLVRATGPADGTPFTQTSSSTAGSLTTATPTAAAGPNFWSVAANWSGAAVPVDADDIIIDNPVSILYGLDQSAIQPATLHIRQGFASGATIGLPARNPAGYAEYRDLDLKIGPVVLTVDCGSGRVRINTGTDQTTVNVAATGTAVDAGAAAFMFKGTHASNAVNVTGGEVGLAYGPGDVATVAALGVTDGIVQGGSGLTLAAIEMSGGEVELRAGVTGNIVKSGGNLTVREGNLAGTTSNDGGELVYMGGGTITAIRTSEGGVTDLSRDPRTKTVTNCTLEYGASWIGPQMYVTYSNPIILQRCSLDDVTLDLGTHITLAVAAGP